MSKVCNTLLIMAAAVTLVGCTGQQLHESPEGAIAAYYRSALDGEFDEMQQVLAKPSEARVTAMSGVARFIGHGVKRCGGRPALMHERVSGGNNSGVVVIRTTFVFPTRSHECEQWKPVDDTIIFREEEGWKVQ